MGWVRLQLSGLSCIGCAQAVDRALEAVPGVRSVAVYYEESAAEVEGEARLEDLLAAVRAAGYEAWPIPNPLSE